MRIFFRIAVGTGALFIACGNFVWAADVTRRELPETIAFGSCYRNGKNPQIWDTVGKQTPDLFLFLGDNVYADTSDMKEMRAEYQALLDEPKFAAFSAKTPILATWDDHDYGMNDAGAEFPAKEGAKVEFMRAFGIADDHPMNNRGGIYHSVMFVDGGKCVQVLMLDTRWFRSSLRRSEVGRGKAYVPDSDPAKTMLGEEQWEWLAKELKEPADLRIICSSIQVIADGHRFEKWANLPLEREKLIGMLNGASGEVIVLSGDRHMGEVAKLGDLIDVTSSGMTNAGGGSKKEKNPNRIGERVGSRNFGLMKIEWLGDGTVKPMVRLLGSEGQTLWPAE